MIAVNNHSPPVLCGTGRGRCVWLMLSSTRVAIDEESSPSTRESSLVEEGREGVKLATLVAAVDGRVDGATGGEKGVVSGSSIFPLAWGRGRGTACGYVMEWGSQLLTY